MLIEDFARIVGKKLIEHGIQTAFFVLNFCPGKPGELMARAFMNALPAELGAAVMASVGEVEAQPTAPMDLTAAFRQMLEKGRPLPPVVQISLSTLLVRSLLRGYVIQ
jgi:hypothetical protein